MSDKQTALADATNKPADPTPPAPARMSGRRGSVSGGLALILALIALALAGYLWYTLSERQGLLGTDVIGRMDALAQTTAQLQASNAAAAQQLAHLQETQDALRSAVTKLANDAGRAQRNWALSEAEQLLVIANERLQLARDVTLALAALRAADRHLQQVANPALLPVRRALARDIARLEAANQVDIPGIALALNTLAGRVDQLPLLSESHATKTPIPPPAPTTPVKGWRAVLHEIWVDLSSLIRIRNDAAPAQPLLPAQETYFLRQNLRLMLFGAQLALLQHDTAVYRSDLATAQAWLEHYFDRDAPLVMKTQQDLAQMQQAADKMHVPDISGSLDALQRVVGARETP